MTERRDTKTGPVDNSHSLRASLKVLERGAVTFTGGFWSERQALNHKVSLKHGYAMLNKAGNLHNLKMAAGLETGSFRGMNFADENVYKWLEAMAWELGRAPDAALQSLADEVITLVQAAQQTDGYLNSYYQLVEPDQKWCDMDFGHELYCTGHLIQAAVALKRALDDDRLLEVVRRLVHHIESIFGPGKQEKPCGHPEVEMALVELYRLTGEKHYLELARFFVDHRGKKQMRGLGASGPEYHQDHVGVREAEGVTGHAVRQMYLAAAVADLYMESGERALLETSSRLWDDMTKGKMYITGGVGSRYDGESFGESFELPTDQCYCETCAAIGNLFWNWRLLLITGESRYADLVERLMYNGILSSPGLNGSTFFYVNPLMLRNGKYVRLSANPDKDVTPSGRPAWHSVSCCPPNFMRLVASLSHYFATIDEAGLQIHQFSNLDLSSSFGRLKMETNFPWDGQVKITLSESRNGPWKLSLRIPGWSQSAAIKVNGQAVQNGSEKGYAIIERHWNAGDIVEADFVMQPFFVEADPRVDSVRNCVAIQRGPIVYCLEEQDQASGINLLDIKLDPQKELTNRWQPELLGGVVTVEGSGFQEDRSRWGKDRLYRPLILENRNGQETQNVRWTAIPYFAWGNRGLKSMRVWVPYTQKS